eukprot:38484-Hanusia_phi.AAC.1
MHILNITEEVQRLLLQALRRRCGTVNSEAAAPVRESITVRPTGPGPARPVRSETAAPGAGFPSLFRVRSEPLSSVRLSNGL